MNNKLISILLVLAIINCIDYARVVEHLFDSLDIDSTIEYGCTSIYDMGHLWVATEHGAYDISGRSESELEDRYPCYRSSFENYSMLMDAIESW